MIRLKTADLEAPSGLETKQNKKRPPPSECWLKLPDLHHSGSSDIPGDKRILNPSG
jgi:hypothetical protein